MADESPGKLQVKPATGFVAWEHASRTGGTVAVVVTDAGLAADTNGTRSIQRRNTDMATRRGW
jgi:hypothetical protein